MSYSNVWAELVFVGFPKRRCLNDCVHYVCIFGLHCMENKLPPIVTHVYSNVIMVHFSMYKDLSQGYAGQI